MTTILITGATSGIGEALAKLAAQSGHQVIACGRNEDKLAELEKLPCIQTCKFDVTNEEETKKALADVKCDIAVLNAGTCEYVDLPELEPDMFKRVFDANVFGVVNMIAGLLPKLEKGNKIVFVDSLARLLPFPRSQAYGASKAALNYMAKSFEVDLANKGIKVQTLSPGFVKTPLTDKNDFPMPMVISADDAAKYMLDGIFKSRSSVYFPRRFSFIVRLLNLLPESVQRKLCIGMRQKPRKARNKK
ncbi:SDR family NAD(P)-dependent oxidoreductase [Brumicola blandensis]|uniref:SDR family NAD(P)-dependent oxidoreductase n=1 Tax=Brumicola blandensis TaxID=3075611 RepID=A0AAW8R9N1_9ALTE|nr:SDR family NAD(P)-dependent oxidoreductase [Alteromonas sp. W409]MDT0583903.1 SDR family NAD(P)-dependent oxidoreductase [Alteromonas sp. W409]